MATLVKHAAFAAAIIGITAIGVVVGGAHAERPTGDSYKAAQGIIETFGSKHAVGYFTSQNGSCNMTLLLAEAATDGERVPSAARVRVNVKAGDKVELGSVEGQSLEIACGGDATSVEVRHGTFKAAFNASY